MNTYSGVIRISAELKDKFKNLVKEKSGPNFMDLDEPPHYYEKNGKLRYEYFYRVTDKPAAFLLTVIPAYKLFDFNDLMEEVSEELGNIDIEIIWYYQDGSGLDVKNWYDHFRGLPKLLRNGLESKKIEFDLDKSFGSTTVCCIGEHWFYFDKHAEGVRPEEYLEGKEPNDLIEKITDALEEIYPSDEYDYYISILKSN